MAVFSNNIFRSKKAQQEYERSFAGKYQKLIKRNSFLYFGLPFMLSIVAGSLYLQKFTAIKWERYDEKYRQLGEEEMLNMIEHKRVFDKKDDFYRLQGLLTEHEKDVGTNDYEMVRVKRREEDEPVWNKSK
ncbi:Cytochrome c oxidase assembly protein COX16 mitochondrial [Spathaspora sp. JA1]|nr:Cytochrome c oxidase assembly protein COX16 mitochondrial [Spathaspora sp. JA1]